MTLTPEQTALVVRTLAERVMGYTWPTVSVNGSFRLTKKGERSLLYWDGCDGKGGADWNPTTSRDDMAEVEARLTDAQTRLVYIAELRKESAECGVLTVDGWLFWLRTVSPLVCAVCLCRALGVQI